MEALGVVVNSYQKVDERGRHRLSLSSLSLSLSLSAFVSARCRPSPSLTKRWRRAEEGVGQKAKAHGWDTEMGEDGEKCRGGGAGGGRTVTG
jgi:hypothetical protein